MTLHETLMHVCSFDLNELVINASSIERKYTYGPMPPTSEFVYYQLRMEKNKLYWVEVAQYDGKNEFINYTMTDNGVSYNSEQHGENVLYMNGDDILPEEGFFQESLVYNFGLVDYDDYLKITTFYNTILRPFL